jgi:hypothetical protein
MRLQSTKTPGTQQGSKKQPEFFVAFCVLRAFVAFRIVPPPGTTQKTNPLEKIQYTLYPE